MLTDPYGLTRLVLRYASSSIDTALATFGDSTTQNNLRTSLAASIRIVYQEEERCQNVKDFKDLRKVKRDASSWISSKLLLDHSLLDIIIKVTECRLGNHFAASQNSLERIFNKAETLPVRPFDCLLSADCLTWDLVPHFVF
jgi:hypothetical protein